MSKNINPCPFCGGDARLIYSTDNHRQPYVTCDTPKCPGCNPYAWHYHTEAEAIEAWNRRVVTDTNDGSKEPERRWIPVTEALPKMKEVVLITNDKGNVTYGQYQGTFRNNNEWFWRHKTLQTVIAWMPLPEPWRGEDGKA